MKYGSVCSGIEAATVAWHSLGWQPAWFSEIEPFPCKVLKYRFPEVPNLGDMTKLINHKIYNDEPINLLVGGTPCQSFSIAGLRGGLSDQRGNLALEFCRILIAKQPQWFVWENVPGVFSSSGGADFEAILAAFLECGYSCAWRVLDAQYYGVPQRRRRVFVVGYLGNDWRPPYAVLFERKSLQRNFETGAKKRQRTAGKTELYSNKPVPTLTRQYSEQSGQDDDITLNVTDTIAFRMGGFGEYTPDKQCGTLKKRDHKDNTDLIIQSFGIDSDKNGYLETMGTLISKKSGGDQQAVTYTIQTSQTSANGSNISEGIAAISKNDKPAVVAFAGQNSACRSMQVSNISPTIEKNKIHSIVYDTTQITSPANRSNPKEELCHTLTKGAHAPLLAQPIARRLTPLECERLQGFPDNWTNIPGAKDRPRYAAIGNSMAVPVMYWIGKRIQMVTEAINKAKTIK